MKTLKRFLLMMLIITSNNIYAQDEGTPCNTGLTSVSVGGGTYASEVSWTISDCDGNLLAEGGAPYEECLDVPDNAIVNMVDSYGDGWNGNVLTIGDNVFELASGSSDQGFIGTCFCDGEWVEETNTYNCSSFSNQISCESIEGCSWEFSWGGWGDNGGNGSSDCVGSGTTTNLYCDGELELVILGCTDPGSAEYNPEANTDDGSCVNLPIYGCTDIYSSNYDPLANTDDGSCIDVVVGCTDESALNYDDWANTDDGSCEYTDISGCTDSEAINYDPTANTDDGSCSFESNSDCENIYITLNNGWNMIGFSCSINIDTEIAFGPIQDKIIIVKDALGNAYLPSWEFNGIGDLERGYGYLLKVSEEINNYSICE